ncbi:uncharacterized protein FFM5_14347 [Fusarium fujikuroi]|nr:uncharacterized protein FFM5_14347 [Fusarium fujikuroi]
MLLHSY